MFISEEEYAATHKQQITNLYEIVEEFVVYTIAHSTYSPEYQLALVSDRVDSLMELSKLIISKCGVEVNDVYDIFVTMLLPESLKRNTIRRCGSYGCKDVVIVNLAHIQQKHGEA